MEKWLISYRHAGGYTIEVSDVHPVLWLLNAKKRERARVEAIVSAIEIPPGPLGQVAEELKDHL